jgi:hypothetical protein
LLAAALGAAPADPRAAARAAGSDRPAAVRVAAALLARPLDAQLLKVRCDRAGTHTVCGLIVSGVKFHHPLDRAAFTAEVRALVLGAFAAAPVEEIDLWATVPLDAGRGAIVSGDLAKPTSATVFAITVTRAELGALDARLANGRDVFWDARFAGDLERRAGR